ncbi:MAG: hypothetical protein K8R79_09340, partial [Calditrichales bacterium]|nr:hypothetical protein [Calditrichales bacterium]
AKSRFFLSGQFNHFVLTVMPILIIANQLQIGITMSLGRGYPEVSGCPECGISVLLQQAGWVSRALFKFSPS